MRFNEYVDFIKQSEISEKCSEKILYEASKLAPNIGDFSNNDSVTVSSVEVLKKVPLYRRPIFTTILFLAVVGTAVTVGAINLSREENSTQPSAAVSETADTKAVLRPYLEEMDRFNRENSAFYSLMTDEQLAKIGCDKEKYLGDMAEFFSSMDIDGFSAYLAELWQIKLNISHERKWLENIEIADGEPLRDMTAVMGDNGREGYVFTYELLHNDVSNPDESVEYMENQKNGTYEPKVLTVFDESGNVIIDTFTESLPDHR